MSACSLNAELLIACFCVTVVFGWNGVTLCRCWVSVGLIRVDGVNGNASVYTCVSVISGSVSQVVRVGMRVVRRDLVDLCGFIGITAR